MKRFLAFITLAAIAVTATSCDALANATNASGSDATTISGQYSDDQPAPSVDDIYSGVVEQVASYGPGAAGYNLHTAESAYNILNFVKDKDLANVNKEELVQNVVAAVGKLDTEKKAVFAYNMVDIGSKLEEASKSDEQLQTIFADVGNVDAVKDLLNSEAVMAGWAKLKDVVSGATNGIDISSFIN